MVKKRKKPRAGSPPAPPADGSRSRPPSAERHEVKPASAGKAQTPSKDPARARLKRALPIVLLTALLTLIFSKSGPLQDAEKLTVEAGARLNTVPAEAQRVAVVNIDDDDYARLFNSRSPLDYVVLRRLVDAAARGGAKVIGVDIDTSDASFRHIMAEQWWPPVVWARAVVIGPDGEMLELKPALGGQPLQPGHHAAPPVLPEDSDNVTRRYRRVVTLNGEDVPTFNWSLYSLFAPAEAAARGPLDESLYVRFAGDIAATHRLHLPASQLLEMSKDAGWASGDLVRDKIVIIGGTYLGQDRHQTPLGLMAGVDVVASATETELMGGGFKPPSNWLKFLLTLFDGVLLVVLFHRVGFKKAILYSLLLIPALALLCSLVAYRGLSGWLYFAPTLVIVLAHQVVEHVKDYRKTILNRSVEMVEGGASSDK